MKSSNFSTVTHNYSSKQNSSRPHNSKRKSAHISPIPIFGLTTDDERNGGDIIQPTHVGISKGNNHKQHFTYLMLLIITFLYLHYL